jgi:hypothetical protein
MTKPNVAKKKSSAIKHKIDTLSGANAKVLNIAASLTAQLGKKEIPRKKLHDLCCIGKSTFANALTKLKNNGFVVVSSGHITVTPQGMEAADIDAANIKIPKTNAEYQKTVQEQYKLKGKQIALMDYLADGRTYKKIEVKDALGIDGKSTWANLMTGLKKHEIIEFDRQDIKMTDNMFEVEGRPN